MASIDPLPRRAGTVRALVVLSAIVLTGTGAWAEAKSAPRPDDRPTGAATVPFALVADRAVTDRLPQPEDRYAVAGGCYTVEAPGQGFVSRAGGTLGLAATSPDAEPFHFQATRLGDYLIATNEGPDTSVEGAWWDLRGYLAASPLAAPAAVTTAGVPVPTGVVVADAPGVDADWRLVAAGPASPQRYQLSLPSRGQVLTARDGALGLSTDAGTATALVLRHVADDDPTDGDANGTACATWPEIETGATGSPTPARTGPAGKVQGFFEAHVHGMAYEFLGGELRCGQPWHPYGVEYALGNCAEDGNLFNGALEVGLAGQSPTDPALAYDPVGWPTFGYWPKHDTLTHEQYYWKWLERAYLGGLRLTTNLLVDNTALCQAYPQKKNSCNEMDGVRLQAQRLFELQDYIDAQAGGPGEGWLRIVTTPAQARETINAGRLAILMGIEISVLFDCGEVLDQPQCTTADIDTRLQEVFDMGVRQMELTNKFDNALSGVTGDGGSTGLVVNGGNKHVTGHFWDMGACPTDEHDHGVEGDAHDKTQLNPLDEAPEGPAEVDVLAGRVLSQFGATKGYVAPVYAPGPHCNSRGLTVLGEHLVTEMIAKGMIFDPDHMSAKAQQQALDLVQDTIVPAERAAAAQQRRPALRPALISSHSWANDVVYQRLYALDGMVAPRTDRADSFAAGWVQQKAWAVANAPAGYDFGLGYGADTNGLGGQPGPRRDPAQPVTYDAQGWAAPIGDVVLRQQRSGVKTYDINVDGVAHYGLFADWFHEVALAADEKFAAQGGGKAITADMLNASEAYLSMWERGVYGGNDCVTDGSRLQVEDLHAALGLNTEGFLTAVGRPSSRDGAVYRYCADGADGEPATVDVTFDPTGAAASVTVRATAVDLSVDPGMGTAGGTSADGHDHVHDAVPSRSRMFGG